MFNIIFTIYDPKHEIIDMHLDIWSKIPIKYRKQMRFIIIDDCSNNEFLPEIAFPINLLIVRIDTNIWWNPPGAKNLGFLLADNDWVFSCDVDHTAEPEEYIKMLILPKKKNNIYFFERFKPNGLSRNKNTPNIFIIHREDFWKTGGYDEDFSGYHGFDDYVFVGNFYEMQYPSLIKQNNIKYNQTNIKIIEHVGFESGDRNRKIKSQTISKPMMYKKLEELANKTYKHGSIIRFQWHIVKEISI